jgi:transmembrane sensor
MTSLDEWLGIGLPDEVVSEAIDWIVKLDSETMSDEERRAFFVWLDEKPEHQWAYEELSEVWSKLHGLKSIKERLLSSEVVPFEVRDKTSPSTVEDQIDPYPVVAWTALGIMLFGLVLSFII